MLHDRRLWIVLLGLCIWPTSGESRVAAGGVNPAYVRSKASPVVSPRAAEIIEARTVANRAKIWVYFTDKGFYDTRGMEAAGAKRGVSLTSRAAARRAKVGRDRIEFLDIPVREVYLDRLRDRGAILRHASRWLNAASFEVNADQIQEIASLPFVHSIRPVIGMTRDPEPENPELESESGRIPDPAGLGPGLNYGLSAGQLQQINVPAAHDLGFAGQGVIVTMLDTGFRKDHAAFSQILSSGRLVADSDFVFGDGDTQDEEGIDQAGSHNHGTFTWSTLGGASEGNLYGPAYQAAFILAKTEDIRSETQIEEDFWTAGIEWAEALGTDVVSSSLGYTDWYTFPDYNGDIAVTSIAADIAVSLGVVVCNSNGNDGPSSSTMNAPSDADSIIAVGAVSATGFVANFSSRGPTFDGRIKPEVSAQGLATWCASAASTTAYTSVSGTSLSCPLVAGAAAIILSAHPDWTPMEVREALMQTASRAGSPDNNLGWGIIDVVAAINYVCVSMAAPDAPTTSNPSPCHAEDFTISWSPVDNASAYELYENGALIYEGATSSTVLNRTSGSYDYEVIAKNSCVVSPISLAGANTSINDCRCHGDAECDGATTVIDVVSVVNEALRGATGITDPSCTHVSRSDVNCDCVVSVVDVVRMINVAFRNGDPLLEFCNPCIEVCP